MTSIPRQLNEKIGTDVDIGFQRCGGDSLYVINSDMSVDRINLFKI